MNTMHWIGPETVLFIHRDLIAEHGGTPELRDESALRAGLMRAQNLHAYGDPPPDIADLAAVYAGGIVLNHPFVDGNKRTGFMLAYTFICDNGYTFTATEVDAVLWTLKLAARACEEKDYAGWLRANMKKVRKPRATTPVKKKTSSKTKPKAKKR